jgi:hypothetical protein
MKHVIIYIVLLLVMTVFARSAYADCPDTPSGTHLYLGVDVSIPVNIASPQISQLDLLRVQVVWVPSAADSRYKDQHLIDIDWVQQTHTNVDVWDGELQQITIRNLHPVLLQINTSFETGQVHIETCPVYDSAGPVLLFAHYGLDGVIFPQFSMVTPVVNSSGLTATAVTNATVSSAISDTFNGYLDVHMVEDVELATGVTPGHYLAQSFLLQNLEPAVRLLEGNPSLFFDARNATVLHNRVYVTADGASARVPLSQAAVISNGENILDGDLHVRNLEQHLGTLQFQSRFSNTPGGYNQVIEARPDVDIGVETCVAGQSVLTANFVHPSEVPGEILLFLGDSPAAMSMGPSLYESISCDYDYRVEGRREFEGQSVSTGEIPVAVFSAGG